MTGIIGGIPPKKFASFLPETRVSGSKDARIDSKDARIDSKDARINRKDARIDRKDARMERGNARMERGNARIAPRIGNLTLTYANSAVLILHFALKSSTSFCISNKLFNIAPSKK